MLSHQCWVIILSPLQPLHIECWVINVESSSYLPYNPYILSAESSMLSHHPISLITPTYWMLSHQCWVISLTAMPWCHTHLLSHGDIILLSHQLTVFNETLKTARNILHFVYIGQLQREKKLIYAKMKKKDLFESNRHLWRHCRPKAYITWSFMYMSTPLIKYLSNWRPGLLNELGRWIT